MATSNEQPKAAADKPAAEQQRTARAAETTTAAPGQRRTTTRTSDNQGGNPGGGVADEARASFERRTTVPGADNVDARLDNRTGADRPKLEEWPAKPQQVDGPDVMHQVEHTRRTLADRETGGGDRKGMFSPGPHGLGDETLREGGEPGQAETLYGTEGLTEGEMPGGSGQPKADG